VVHWGGWPWTSLFQSCARVAPAVAIRERSGDTCFGGDVARIKILEKGVGGCHLGSWSAMT
jgi:hypothetical protein